MIRWTKRADGTWVYDYSLFDRWVGLCAGEGIDRQINCYSMLPWNNELNYYDAAADRIVEVRANPGTPEFEAMWGPFLRDFEAHLDAKGWLGKCCVAMDERSPETMDAAIGLLRSAAPGLGIAMADNHASYKRYADLDDVCVQIDCRVADEDLARRRRDGLLTTYYVCCSSAFPNTFTFSEPWEAVYMAWFAAACGYDGMLRWSYNSWPADPVRDSRFTAWPAGDTYLVYPDARSSIRFERLREGIQDYEKIRILRGELASDNTPEGRRKTRRTRGRDASLRSARPRTAVARPAPQGQGDARPPERIAAVRRRIGRGAWGPLPIFYRFAVCAVRRKSPSPLLLPISGRMRAVVSNSENALRLSVRRFLNLHCHAGVLES